MLVYKPGKDKRWGQAIGEPCVSRSAGVRQTADWQSIVRKQEEKDVAAVSCRTQSSGRHAERRLACSGGLGTYTPSTSLSRDFCPATCCSMASSFGNHPRSAYEPHTRSSGRSTPFVRGWDETPCDRTGSVSLARSTPFVGGWDETPCDRTEFISLAACGVDSSNLTVSSKDIKLVERLARFSLRLATPHLQ